MGIANRVDPLEAAGIKRSGLKALDVAGIGIDDIDFFELHDAYSILATLTLEALGFAKKGEGWKLAVEEKITPNGSIPIATFGGLKARGHPIGASGVYQAVEAYLQLTDLAGDNQLKKDVHIGLIQSIGGTASTILTHVLVKQ